MSFILAMVLSFVPEVVPEVVQGVEVIDVEKTAKVVVKVNIEHDRCCRVVKRCRPHWHRHRCCR